MMEESVLPLFGNTLRYLSTTTTNDDTTNDEDDASSNSNGRVYDDAEVLKGTLVIYGGALLLTIAVFALARRAFPKVYRLRNWVPDTTGDCSTFCVDEQQQQQGFYAWIAKMYTFRDDEILRKCGMDALCFIRIAKFGYRLSLMGMFNAVWLVGVYGSAPVKHDTQDIDDLVVQISIAHVPTGSWQRFLAVVVAAYIFFGYAMYLVLQDFGWYTRMRHEFLRHPLPRNYAVFIRNIPPNYRNNLALEQFMKSCFSNDDVLEARVAVTISQLAATLQSRTAVLAKLEHALAVFDKTGVRPTHRQAFFGERLDSIETYQGELDQLNDKVERERTEIENKITASLSSASNWNRIRHVIRAGLAASLDASPRAGQEGMVDEESMLLTENGENGIDSLSMQEGNETTATDPWGAVGQFAAGAAGQVGDALNNVGNLATGAVGEAAAILVGKEDGERHPAGFVVFTKLSTVNAALQTVHHSTPFSMEVTEAPDPKDVNWVNISRTHEALQIGKLTSLAMTVGLCLLWTIPMSFIASLSSVEGLRKKVAVVNDILNDFPALVPFFEIAAPLLVVIANSLLPTILTMVTSFEGPISKSVAAASLFAKLSGFMTIQTFFVSAISGSIIAKLEEILDSPKTIIDLLAKSLPSQSTYFIQISFVSIVVQSGMELLRVVPIVMATLRSFVGPRLTEKEKSTTYFGLRTLNDPAKFSHADFTAQAVLYFMVLLVYSILAPLTNFFLAFNFLFLEAVLRHQFLYVYPRIPDSGGKLWSHFIGIFLGCMLFAQITMLGLLGLKKAKVASPCFLPLMIISALFSFYIRQQHFRVASFLPTRNCLREDVRRGDMDMSFLVGAYLQPELACPRRVGASSPSTESLGQLSESREDYHLLT